MVEEPVNHATADDLRRRGPSCRRGASLLFAAVLCFAVSVESAAQAIETLRPNGAGNSTDNTPAGCGANWECVDEVTADDGATYVFSGVNSWLTDTYALDNSTGTGTINSVTVFIRSSCTNSPPPCRVQTVLRTYSTDFIGASETPGATWADFSTTYATNPSTGNPWAWAEIDALEVGVQQRGQSNQGVEAQTTQVWVEVDFAAIPQMDIAKSVSPGGTPTPSTDLAYTLTITNNGSADAVDVTVIDSLASELQFRVGSVVNTLPPGIAVTLEYSDDGGSTWTYSPVSGGCGAPVSYDDCVSHIRWTLQDDLPSSPPDNTGQLEFIARIE